MRCEGVRGVSGLGLHPSHHSPASRDRQLTGQEDGAELWNEGDDILS